eukprot:SAG11_NODE_490_length_8982_cov_5.961162_6_plen_249_part_00
MSNTTASPEQPRSAAGSSKRHAADQPPPESDTDRLIAALLQDRAEARAAAAAQQQLVAEQIQLGRQQLAEIAELRRAAASPPNITVQPPAITFAAPNSAAQAPAAAAAAQPAAALALTSAVQVLVDRAVDEAEKALHTANRARVAKEELEKLVFDANPAVGCLTARRRHAGRSSPHNTKVPIYEHGKVQNNTSPRGRPKGCKRAHVNPKSPSRKFSSKLQKRVLCTKKIMSSNISGIFLKKRVSVSIG